MEHSRKQRSKTVCLKSVSQMIGYNIFVVTIVSIHMKCLTGLCSVYASNFVGDTSESREEFNQDIIQWTHSVFLDGEDTRNIRLSWNLMDDNVLLKVEARTKGYVGIGFSKNGRMAGADILIGWVRDQQAFLQVISHL